MIDDLRSYQLEAVESAYQNLTVEDHAGTLVVMATGTGKTRILAAIAERWFREKGQRVLLLAHRRKLVHQLRKCVVALTDFKDWEAGVERAGFRSKSVQPIIVGSVPTLQNEKRLKKTFDPNEFGLIVIDEAHHVPAKSFQVILSYFQAKRLGLTATPFRSDGQNLGPWFESHAIHYPIRQAIDDRFLVPITLRRRAVTEMDLRKVKRTAGDFNRQQLAAIMEEPELIRALAELVHEYAEDRPTLVFNSSVRHALKFEAALNGLDPGSTAAVYSSCVDPDIPNMSEDEQDRVQARFESGEIRVVTSFDLWSEFLDIPKIACLVMLRPTQSLGKYVQQLGRGTRLLGPTMEDSIANGKEDLLVLDFVGVHQHRNHPQIECLDALLPDIPPEVRAGVRKALERRPADPLSLAVTVARKIEQERKARAKGPKPDADATRAGLGGTEVMFPTFRPSEMDASSTPEQVTELGKFGYPDKRAKKLSTRQAAQLLIHFEQRKKLNRATYRQVRQLHRYGLTDRSFKEATEVMQRLQKAGWPRPQSRKFRALGLE